ncbi:MAG: hypothetical protein ACYDBQ_08835 [Thermoplasmatota archaeon]
MPLSHAEVDGWGWGPATAFAPAPRATAFSTVKDPRFRGYRRAAVGGFGRLVPAPGSAG